MTIDIPADFTQFCLQTFPNRLVNEGLSGQFGGLCVVVPQSIVWQALSEAVLARSQNQPTSPDDELPELGQECGFNQYPIEQNDAFRVRLTNKWNIAPTMASQIGITDQLQIAGFPTGSVTPTFLFNLPGGGGNTGDYLNTGIPYYQPSSVWYSQFCLVMFFAQSVGSGAEGRSALIDDDQLLTIRLIVAKWKPIDWACREIILISGSSPVTGSWDSINPSGSYLYEWDGSGPQGIDWTASGSVGIERYAANNSYSWRPLYPSAT